MALMPPEIIPYATLFKERITHFKYNIHKKFSKIHWQGTDTFAVH